MEANYRSTERTNQSLWHWPYLALTEVAILQVLGALYMLLFIYYVVPFDNNAGFDLANIRASLSYFAFLAGSILIFLKRKLGIFVSLAGIIYLIGIGLYSSTQPPFNTRPDIFNLSQYLTDFTDPYGIPALAVGVTLLIVGWRKVRWNNASTESNGNALSKDAKSSPLRILLFATLPIVSVLLLYFIFVTEVRDALRYIGAP